MDDGPTPADGEDDNVVVTSGDVTSISDPATDGEPVAAGGPAIAVSLTADPDVLNIAFVTGGGDVQFVQIPVTELLHDGVLSTEGDVVVSAELTALSGDIISSGGGAATPVGTVAVATSLTPDGELNLSFVDGNGAMQLIETNVAELLEGLRAVDGDPSAPAKPDAA